MTCIWEQICSKAFYWHKWRCISLFLYHAVAQKLHVAHLGYSVTGYVYQAIQTFTCSDCFEDVAMEASTWRINNTNYLIFLIRILFGNIGHCLLCSSSIVFASVLLYFVRI